MLGEVVMHAMEAFMAVTKQQESNYVKMEQNQNRAIADNKKHKKHEF
jgi:hypothetical protein